MKKQGFLLPKPTACPYNEQMTTTAALHDHSPWLFWWNVTKHQLLFWRSDSLKSLSGPKSSPVKKRDVNWYMNTQTQDSTKWICEDYVMMTMFFSIVADTDRGQTQAACSVLLFLLSHLARSLSPQYLDTVSTGLNALTWTKSLLKHEGEDHWFNRRGVLI